MSRNLPSLNALRAFEAAARHQSLTRAATELFVTHAAISRHVRLLEEWLEVELFVRHPQGVTLTDAGERYLRRLTPIFDALVAATRELRADDIVSTLTISVEVPFATRWLIPRLGQLRAVCPHVELNINPSDKLISFRDNEAQFGIRFGTGEWPDVTAVRLTNVEIFPVCSPALIEGRELGGDLSALQDFTLIHEAKKRYWQRWLELVGVDAVDTQKGPILSNIHFALQAAEAGEGFALGDNVLTHDALARGTLVRPFAKTVAIRRGYFLVHPSHGQPVEGAQSFIEWLRAELQAQESAWQGSKGTETTVPLGDADPKAPLLSTEHP
ncbi:MAG: transcriptional regulator GcvA [Pseudomonadota bacterium]